MSQTNCDSVFYEWSKIFHSYNFVSVYIYINVHFLNIEGNHNVFRTYNMNFSDVVLNRVPVNGMDLRRGNFSSAGYFFGSNTYFSTI